MPHPPGRPEDKFLPDPWFKPLILFGIEKEYWFTSKLWLLLVFVQSNAYPATVE